MNLFNSIQTRLTFTVGGGIVFLILVASGAVFELRSYLQHYQQLVQVSIENERHIQDLNFTFKVQVQEWKNILLRGKDPEQYQKYWAEFQKLQREIQEKSSALQADLPKGESQALVKDFIAAHNAAFAKYETGLKVFSEAGFDPAAGDKAVSGIDREASRMLSEAAVLISKEVKTSSEEINSGSVSVAFWSQLIVVICGLAILALVWMLLKNALIAPLFRINAHLHTLASGDFSQHLSLGQKGEMGALNNSINTVQASIIMVLDTIKNSSKTLNSSSSDLTQTATGIASATHEIHSSTDQMATALEEMSATV